jgi:UDP-N-acetylmuramoyl-L-alanyl-D-glutamate--2,6-diaminopimelate ligase
LPNGAAAYVDYAHTPDALERLLSALRPHTAGKLHIVFGAGGDRDRGKRSLMGEVAARLADQVIVTDDNPRGEDPQAIRAAVLSGCPAALEIGDRASAIEAALNNLGSGDVLVVAGKGHEQGQTISGVVHPFDDVSVIRELVGVLS